MDLHDSHFCSFVIHVLVESHQSRFVGLDEVHQPRHTLPFCFEPSRLESVRGDEDEWARHQLSSSAQGRLKSVTCPSTAPPKASARCCTSVPRSRGPSTGGNDRRTPAIKARSAGAG